MRRDDARLVGDTEPVEGARGVLHRLPIGLAPHDDAYCATGAAHSTSSTMWLRGAAILEAGSAHTSAPEDRPRNSVDDLSGDDIGQQLALDLRDLVLEQQLSLLQALQLELVERSALREPGDHLIEVAMLRLQDGELGLQGFYVEIHG